MDKSIKREWNTRVPTRKRYEETHPWLKFEYKEILSGLDWVAWLNLGECYSKCAHLLGAPIGPNKAEELSRIYMRKGAWATTQIEGNTLSQQQVDEILDKDLTLPESLQYQEQELRNVILALSDMEQEITEHNSIDPTHSSNFEISTAWIKEVNAKLLENIEVLDHVMPGQYRNVSVGVMGYRAAPAEDLEFLMEKYCEWINSLIKNANEVARTRDPIEGFASIFVVAVLSHLYFAWIHPFGDGNGRTARLIECALLAHSNLVPWISTNILSDYYNKTRDIYYRKLDAASQNGEVIQFVKYGIQGFKEQIAVQVLEVQKFQREIAWNTYINETFGSESPTAKTKRQQRLASCLEEGEPLTTTSLMVKNSYVHAIYSTLPLRTLKRDLDELVKMGLVQQVGRNLYRANTGVIDGFKPLPQFGLHVGQLET